MSQSGDQRMSDSEYEILGISNAAIDYKKLYEDA